MAVTATKFDVEAFKRAYEQWDLEALLDLYAEDVELVQIDRDNPPSSRACATAGMCSAGCSSTAKPRASRRPWSTPSRGPIAPPPPSPVSSRAAARCSPTRSSRSQDGRIVVERDVLSDYPKGS